MSTESNNSVKIIAVCGKGGVGKTSISASIVRSLLKRNNSKVLAIDADPAVGLATAMGIEVSKTIDEIRNKLIDRLESGTHEEKRDLISLLDFEVLDAMVENKGLAFLAIGRPETEGCYCQVNDILKDIIGSLAGNFDYVVIDGEAGIEQVNRRVMETVTHLLLVSDASAKGLNVVRTINEVAGRVMNCEWTGLLVNRIRTGDERGRLRLPEDMQLAGWIPEDDSIRDADIAGESILALQDSPALTAIERCLERMDLPDKLLVTL